MPRLRRIGRIVLWTFAILGMIYAVVFGGMVIQKDTPWGGCYIAKEQRPKPGTAPYQAAQIVLARAQKKYPEIDFSKRWLNVDRGDVPDSWGWKYTKHWIVTLREPPETNLFGCHPRNTPGIQGNVLRKTMTLDGDVGPEKDFY